MPRPTSRPPRRVDLETVGPLVWSPTKAEPIALADTDGKPWTLADHKGRNVVVLFYLGNKCAHCMQQLQDFGKQIEAFRKLNTDVVAISTDDPDDLACPQAKQGRHHLPHADPPRPDLALFKTYRAHDDFEDAPLHGAFLIDARGLSASSGSRPTRSSTSISSRRRRRVSKLVK